MAEMPYTPEELRKRGWEQIPRSETQSGLSWSHRVYGTQPIGIVLHIETEKDEAFQAGLRVNAKALGQFRDALAGPDGQALERACPEFARIARPETQEEAS